MAFAEHADTTPVRFDGSRSSERRSSSALNARAVAVSRHIP